MNNDLTTLDRDLLLSALDGMTRRFIKCAKDFGYDDKFIDVCTDYEIALVHRIKQRLDLSTRAELTGEATK